MNAVTSMVRVCEAAELELGARQVVEVNGRRVLITRTPDQQVFAVSAVCPHQGADLAKGTLGGTVCSTGPGRYAYARIGEILRCPWHQYEFDVRDGITLVRERRNQLKTYEVLVDDGVIYVSDRRGHDPDDDEGGTLR